MPILYPASLDTLTNPSAVDTLASAPHDEQHANANDAIEAIETKLGTGASTPTNVGDVLTVTGSGATAYQAPTGGAPANADYLVGTANGSLSNEIVVGTTPGGELGGTWSSPTVDAMHSGSTHAATQAAAEATAAAALSAHEADTTSIHGIADTGVLATDSDVSTAVSNHAAAADPHTGYQKESEKGAANGYASLGAGGLVPIAQIASGTPDGTKFVRDDGTLAVPAGGGLGAWTAYTPTWTATSVNPAIGNGSISGRYKALDSKTYAIQIKLAIGSTTTPGTGTWEFSLPSVTSGSFAQVLHGLIADAGTRFYIATGVINNGSTKTNPILYQADSTGVGTVTHNTPITWASGDEIYLDGIIEVA